MDSKVESTEYKGCPCGQQEPDDSFMHLFVMIMDKGRRFTCGVRHPQHEHTFSVEERPYFCLIEGQEIVVSNCLHEAVNIAVERLYGNG